MTEPSTKLDGARVLLVDDESSVRVALALQLGRFGVVVTEASSGTSAVELLEQNEFDVVLSDINMHEMEGTKLLELVSERFHPLPVVLMTGAPALDSAMTAVRHGAFEYLAKPIDPEVLRSALVRARARCSAERERLRRLARQSDAPGSDADVQELGWTGRLLAGRYRVGRAIGSGGMGEVYEAVREDLADMAVAVKVLHPVFSGRGDLVQRFRREAEIVALLEHPNIVRLIDFHTRRGGPTFIVMERLRGATLAATLASEGPLSVPRVAFIASQLLAALASAHAAGVIHRDLKPDNVFLTEMSGLSDIVKVLDFGIAKLLGATGEQKLTETGTILGTPAYMAPEYARGGHIDHRADVYAAGCIMYECLTGQPPFSAENYNALLFAIQEQEPVPLGELRTDLPEGLVDVVGRAMARSPDARFPTASAMARELKPWIATHSSLDVDTRDGPPVGSAPTVLVGWVEDPQKGQR